MSHFPSPVSPFFDPSFLHPNPRPNPRTDPRPTKRGTRAETAPERPPPARPSPKPSPEAGRSEPPRKKSAADRVGGTAQVERNRGRAQVQVPTVEETLTIPVGCASLGPSSGHWLLATSGRPPSEGDGTIDVHVLPVQRLGWALQNIR